MVVEGEAGGEIHHHQFVGGVVTVHGRYRLDGQIDPAGIVDPAVSQPVLHGPHQGDAAAARPPPAVSRRRVAADTPLRSRYSLTRDRAVPG